MAEELFKDSSSSIDAVTDRAVSEADMKMRRFHSVDIVQKISSKMHTAIFYFTTNTQNLIQSTVTVKTLKMIAQLRLCFEYITELLAVRYLRQRPFESAVIECHSNLFHELVDYLKTGGGHMTEAHLFILRNVIFEYGFEELKLIVLRSGLGLALDFDEIEEVS